MSDQIKMFFVRKEKQWSKGTLLGERGLGGKRENEGE